MNCHDSQIRSSDKIVNEISAFTGTSPIWDHFVYWSTEKPFGFQHSILYHPNPSSWLAGNLDPRRSTILLMMVFLWSICFFCRSSPLEFMFHFKSLPLESWRHLSTALLSLSSEARRVRLCDYLDQSMPRNCPCIPFSDHHPGFYRNFRAFWRYSLTGKLQRSVWVIESGCLATPPQRGTISVCSRVCWTRSLIASIDLQARTKNGRVWTRPI